MPQNAGQTRLYSIDLIANKMLHIVRLFIYSFEQWIHYATKWPVTGTQLCWCEIHCYRVWVHVRMEAGRLHLLLMAMRAFFTFLKISLNKMAKHIDQMEISHVCVCFMCPHFLFQSFQSKMIIIKVWRSQTDYSVKE